MWIFTSPIFTTTGRFTYFYPHPTAYPKIGNKTVEVILTDRRFAATFSVRDFRPKP